jgi:hypothetical protein
MDFIMSIKQGDKTFRWEQPMLETTYPKAGSGSVHLSANPVLTILKAFIPPSALPSLFQSSGALNALGESVAKLLLGINCALGGPRSHLFSVLHDLRHTPPSSLSLTQQQTDLVKKWTACLLNATTTQSSFRTQLDPEFLTILDATTVASELVSENSIVRGLATFLQQHKVVQRLNVGSWVSSKTSEHDLIYELNSVSGFLLYYDGKSKQSLSEPALWNWAQNGTFIITLSVHHGFPDNVELKDVQFALDIDGSSFNAIKLPRVTKLNQRYLIQFANQLPGR